jgi:hypothetical protein|tara:strand:- start:2694 stop:2882 length:189 start_codon:yes stop_codon:yes gene_type:complete
MYDIDTIQVLRAKIRDNLEKYKEDVIYGVDTMENLQYARGRINALETLLQDLNDLQKKEENL